MIRSTEYPKQTENPEQPKLTANSFSHTLGGLTKRALDIIASLIGLILLSPLFLLVAILIKRDSPGPVFYWGPRIGRNGAMFKMLKFRTMHEDARSYSGPRVTCKGDDRITRIGKWLRDTKLNELPQLWNVLVGDMSLVGPRPEDPSLEKTWPTDIAVEILSVRPGITSPASVVYRDEERMLHADDVMRKYLHELSPDKLRLDQLYVRYRSFWLDLDVIFWTFLLLIPRIKAFSPPEQMLFVGPVSRLIQRYVNWFMWDFLIVLVSIGFTGTVVRLFGPLNLGLFRAIGMAFGFSILYTMVGILLRTNHISWPKASSWESLRLWIIWFIVTVGVLCFHAYFGFASLRLFGVILGAATLSLAGIVFVRYRGQLIGGMLNRLLQHRLNKYTTRERVLIVGSGRTAQHMAWLFDHPAYSGKFEVVGFIDDNLLSQGMKIYGSRVIGRIEDIQRIAGERDVGLIILANSQTEAREYREFRDAARFNPARILVAPDIFGSLSSLDGALPEDVAAGDLDDFQCRHCVARPPRSQGQVEQAGLRGSGRGTVRRLSALENRKKWRISGQRRKSL